jgi:hypothetical protein
MGIKTHSEFFWAPPCKQTPQAAKVWDLQEWLRAIIMYSMDNHLADITNIRIQFLKNPNSVLGL